MQTDSRRAADPALDTGRLWGYVSYAGVIVGLPLFIVPLAMRDNAFALYHAKQAAVATGLFYLLGLGTFAFAWLTCGLGMPLVVLAFLPTISVLHGLTLCANGEMREPVLLFGLAERHMPNLQAR